MNLSTESASSQEDLKSPPESHDQHSQSLEPIPVFYDPGSSGIEIVPITSDAREATAPKVGGSTKIQSDMDEEVQKRLDNSSSEGWEKCLLNSYHQRSSEDNDNSFRSPFCSLKAPNPENSSHFGGLPTRSFCSEPAQQRYRTLRPRKPIYNSGYQGPVKRHPEFQELEKQLCIWLLQQTQIVTQEKIQKRAVEMCELRKNYGWQKFKASRGWLEKFWRRNRETKRRFDMVQRELRTALKETRIEARRRERFRQKHDKRDSDGQLKDSENIGQILLK